MLSTKLGLSAVLMELAAWSGPVLFNSHSDAALISYLIAHAIASSRVGELAISNKGHATSLYLLFYYLGSSIVGAYGGNIWQSHGWNGIVILNIFLILIALIVIFSIKPLHSPSVTH